MTSEQFLDAYATSIRIARQLMPPVQGVILEMVYHHIAAGAPVEKFEKAMQCFNADRRQK